MEFSNQAMSNLAKTLKDGKNQTDSLAILILTHLINALNTVVIDKDGFFLYEYRIFQEIFDCSHKVIRDRLDSLQTAGLIQFVSKTKSSLRIKIEFEQMESLLAENSPTRDIIHISEENSFSPSRNIFSPSRDRIDAHDVVHNNIINSKNDYYYYDDDESANLTRTGSNTDVADAITKILSIIQIAKSALNENMFKKVLRLFNQDINLFFDPTGTKIEFASTSFSADEFLRSIATLTPERVVEVLNRVENQHIQTNWPSYTLVAMYKESEIKYIPRTKTAEKNDEKKSSSTKLGYTNKTNYDFAALQKYINEN